MKKWIGAIVLLIVICVAVPAMSADVTVPGSMQANSFAGDGSLLTNLPGGNIAAGSVITAGTVNTTSIANYAITPGKIGFYQNHVAIVATSGGDYTDPSTAMTNYPAWCPAPSATNPCLLKIMPGVYTVGSSVVMQAYIDIEGSGETTPRITSALSSSVWPPDTATLQGASNAELRFLTVENTGGTENVAILNTSQSPSMLHVTASASGGSSSFGIFNNASSPTMTNVTATGSGGTYSYGVYNYASSPTMTNVTATATGGTGDNYGVYNCISSSPAMTNVTATATASGGAFNYGVYNSTSSPAMTNVTATATGGGWRQLWSFQQHLVTGDDKCDGYGFGGDWRQLWSLQFLLRNSND